MNRAVIAIVDAAHARLYRYEHPDGEAPWFREERDLVNPGRQAHGMFADAQARAVSSGASAARAGSARPGGHASVDDHREGHIAALEARFARRIVAELDRLAREHAYARVILVASPRMLGTLRGVYGPLARPELELVEIGQDLAWLTSPQLHDQLAAMRLIAPRSRAAFARGPRTR